MAFLRALYQIKMNLVTFTYNSLMDDFTTVKPFCNLFKIIVAKHISLTKTY